MGQRAPQIARGVAVVLFLCGIFFALVGFGIVPESFNQGVSRIPFFGLVSLLLLLPLALAYGVYYLVLSVRGFDDMTVTETGLVFPRRPLSDIVRNRPFIIPYAWIRRVASRETQGRLWVDVEFTLPDGRRRRPRVSQSWIPDFPAFCAEFEQWTGRRVE
jgi:hypothetical protein